MNQGANRDSDALYETYLAALARAQLSCSDGDWLRAGEAWSDWLSEYRLEKREVLIAVARIIGH
jgi:hypothetical protein